MAPIYSLAQAQEHGLLRGASCAFGVFDGFHVGHRYIVGKAQQTARESGCRSIALTFDVDPDELFCPGTLRKLQPNGQRLETLAASGVDAVVVIDFNRAFAAQEPGKFLESAFGTHAPGHLHVGSNFRFGARAQGTVLQLEAWGAQCGCKVHAHRLQAADGLAVSSTRIRELLAQGNIKQANALLGHAYQLGGQVVPGRRAGRSMGFPTANIQVDPSLRALADGVYAAYAQAGKTVRRAAVSLGESPLFADEGAASCEVHLLDFEGTLYGSVLQVRFFHRLRGMQAFANVDQLMATVHENIAWVRDNMPENEAEA